MHTIQDTEKPNHTLFKVSDNFNLVHFTILWFFFKERNNSHRDKFTLTSMTFYVKSNMAYLFSR